MRETRKIPPPMMASPMSPSPISPPPPISPAPFDPVTVSNGVFFSPAKNERISFRLTL